jgi:hypothetical protein
MMRKAAMIAGILACVWMILPEIRASATEMGFEAGSPDPNLYRTTIELGWPLSWVEVERDRQETRNRDEYRIRYIDPLNLVVHLVAIWVPFRIYRRE